MELNYQTVKESLKKNVLEVTFEKLNGEERIMTCTLMESKIPESMKPKGSSNHKENKDVISVYDLNAEGWRSFRVDHLKNVTVA